MLLFGADSISQVGSQISLVAIPLVAILVLRAGPLEIGLLTAAQTSGFVLIGLPAGVWVDRTGRRPLLIGSDLARAVLLGSIPVAWWLGALGLLQLYVVAVGVSFATVLFEVAYQSYLPTLVDREQLVDGNGKLEIVRSSAQVAGPGFGGWLVTLVSAPAAIVLDALSFLGSAAFLSRIDVVERPPQRTDRSLVREIREGLAFVLGHRLLRVIAARSAMANLCFSAVLAVQGLFLIDEVGLSPGVYGTVLAAGAVGGLVGSALCKPLTDRVGSARIIWVAPLVFQPFALLIPLTFPGIGVGFFLVGTFAEAVGVVLYNVGQLSFRQAITPPRLLGRMNATMRFLVWGTMPLGALLGGALGEMYGVRTALWLAIGGRLLSVVLLSPLLGMRDLPPPHVEVRSPPMTHRDFPMPRRCPYAPPPEYAEMRAEAPLVQVRFREAIVWVVTRHAEAQAILTDNRVSTDPTRPGHPFAAMVGTPKEQAGQFIDMDPPEHHVYRRMLAGEFSVHRVREMRPQIQQRVDAVIDTFLSGGDTDLVRAFSLPIATVVICDLLGVPYADHEFFHTRTSRMIAGFFSSEEAATARTELVDYLDGLVTTAEQGGGDGLIARMVTARQQTGELSHDALTGMIFLLLVAGHQTVANLLPLGVFTLLQHPSVLAELRADPGLWPAAVDELLRYHSIVDWVAFDRVAIEDLEVGGQKVQAGEGIFVLGASANRDERAFEQPDVFDIHRNARHHLGFGFGVHQCLGQNLARAEIELSLRTLFERLPNLALGCDPADLPFKYDARTFGMQRLPVTW